MSLPNDPFLTAIASRARPRIGDRVVVILAHPDDETIGCGALLPRLDDVRLICVTDGAPRNGEDARRRGFADPATYAVARRSELARAVAIAEIDEARCSCLGIPDQGAADALVAVARRLGPIVADADVVLTHALEGGHPDHDATALAVRAAVFLAGNAARVIEMPFYRAGPGNAWLRRDFAADTGFAELRLTENERDLKRRMLAAHASQAATLADFDTDRDLYRAATPYRLDELPNEGDLLYERHGWGLTGAGWLARVEAARRDLELGAWL